MKKILMTTNGMQIGGAETHILELAIELNRMGYDITVASAGGVYVHELEVHGIKHVKIPLDSQNIFKMTFSFFKLWRLIKKEKYDIVHAHARIPAFLCGIIKKFSGFRFITSAHWVFDVTPVLRLLANWGERTVAVSNDIKQYLIDNYGVPADRIGVTINGIDTQKFSPNTDAFTIEKELDLDNECKRIVYVSRMDTTRSAVAFMLLEIIDKIEEKVQLIIVGSGDDLERLQIAATAVNRKMDRNAVIVAGQRLDINKCVALGDIFVGVSRAALEAMSAAKPVIISGNEGHIGIFSEQTYSVALETNFCCRGCAAATPELLLNDVNALFKENLAEIGRYNRQVILDNYSVHRMTMDYVEEYNKLLQMQTKGIILSGYYGYKNIGDDAVLSVILQNVRDVCPDTKITVLSKTPGEIRGTHGVNCVQRFNIFGVIRAMKRSKLLISGGGSLFQDITSTHSLLYYKAIIDLASKLGLKIMVYANGIGPLKLHKNKQRTMDAISKADIITLRDQDSFKELLSMGMPAERMEVTADPAFALEGASLARQREIYDAEGLSFSDKYFAVSVRDWQYVCFNFENKIADICRYVMSTYGMKPLFIPMQQSKDKEISLRIRALVGDDAKILNNSYSVEDILCLMGNMEFVMGMRLHTLIYAISQCVPVVGLSYDPKVDAMLHQIGIDTIVQVDNIDGEQLQLLVDGIIENKAALRSRLEMIVNDLKAKTLIDTQKAIELYRS